MTTYTELVASAEAKARPILGEVCATIADVQVRNRGTIGGNVCSNDPTNHLPPLMVAVGARMTIAGPGGEREVSAEEFFLGVYMTAVGPGELLTRISIPAGKKDGFAAITLGADGTCIATPPPPSTAPSASRSAASTPCRCCVTADSPDGRRRRRPRGEPRRRPPTSTRPSDYRIHLAAVLAERAAQEAASPLMDITVTVNGTTYERDVEPRKLSSTSCATTSISRAATSAATPATAARAR